MIATVYPITPNVPEYSPHQAVRGFTQVSSSDESDNDVVSAQPLQPAYDEEAGDHAPLPGRPPDLSEVPIPGEIDQPLVPPPPAQEVRDQDAHVILQGIIAPLVPRCFTSIRVKKPNTFLNDGNWSLSDRDFSDRDSSGSQSE